MMTNKILPIVLGVIGLVFLALAVYYFVTPANALMHWVPGYDAMTTVPHTKHALAALVLAVGAGVLAWFSLGKKTGGDSSAQSEQ